MLYNGVVYGIEMVESGQRRVVHFNRLKSYEERGSPPSKVQLLENAGGEEEVIETSEKFEMKLPLWKLVTKGRFAPEVHDLVSQVTELLPTVIEMQLPEKVAEQNEVLRSFENDAAKIESNYGDLPVDQDNGESSDIVGLPPCPNETMSHDDSMETIPYGYPETPEERHPLEYYEQLIASDIMRRVHENVADETVTDNSAAIETDETQLDPTLTNTQQLNHTSTPTGLPSTSTGQYSDGCDLVSNLNVCALPFSPLPIELEDMGVVNTRTDVVNSSIPPPVDMTAADEPINSGIPTLVLSENARLQRNVSIPARYQAFYLESELESMGL